LVEEVLEFSQADGGQLVVQPQQFEVAPLVESVVESMRMSAEKTGVRVNLDIGSECETMCSDPVRVQQLLRSIIGNAVKFTGSGAVSVQVICTEPNLLVFEVRDTGIGMTAEELSCVFDDFYQAPRPDGVKHTGAGLGLAVSRRIAEMLGGRIEAESTPGVGSVFRLFLPRHCP
ncbi:MAG: HAMP domain-containing sensor histidine kinase, partial [Actinomycetota bacterium]|nr:HAMP domain-containing sensor histidine kinase [Actinomycetota bacterium]